MKSIKGIFRPLVTDGSVYAHDLPSGTALDALNVTLDGTVLRGRYGFGEFDANVSGAAAVLSMFVAGYANGNVYVFAKRADGKLYHRMIHPTDAASFTAITDKWSGHNESDAGWWWFNKDRVYYADRKGVTKLLIVEASAAYVAETAYSPGDCVTYGGVKYLCVTAATGKTPGATSGYWTAGVWKGGIASTTGPTPEAAADGQKQGYYHVVVTKYDANEDAESIISHSHTPGIQTLITNGYGGLSITNHATICAANTDYEFNRVRYYCSMGGTELNYGREAWSFVWMLESEIGRTQTTAGLARADKALNPSEVFTNTGGLPPGARHGFWNGSRCVYANVYPLGALIEGQIWQSIPGHPCMVPSPTNYSFTNGTASDQRTIMPKPWSGIISAVAPGKVTGVGAVDARWVIFTQDGCFWLLPQPSTGRLEPMRCGFRGGCLSETGVVVTQRAVHAIGKDTWAIVDGRGIRDAARNQFTPTVQGIATDYADQTVGAAFDSRDEAWLAVARGTPFDCDAVKVVAGAEIDDITTTALLASFTYNYQLFPDAAKIAADDYVAFGWTAKPASVSLALILARSGAYAADALTWQYSKAGGLWGAITPTDGTHPTETTGSQSFVKDGTITGTPPSDWATAVIDGSTCYWLRAKVATPASITTAPILRNPGATRILVYDESRNGLTSIYDPMNLRAASIRAMCQMSSPSHSARMLVGLSDGRILYWPSAAWTDSDSTGDEAYPTLWRGLYLQEASTRSLRLDRIDVHMGDNDTSNGVTIGAAMLPTAVMADVTDSTVDVVSTLDVANAGVEFNGNLHGNVLRLTFSTNPLGSARWVVNDLIVRFTDEPEA